jgi:hypothetical protein
MKNWRSETRTARQPLSAFMKAPKNDLAYPEEIKTAQTMLEKLDAQAKQIDTAIRQKRDIANVGANLGEPSQLSKEFARLKEQAGALKAH